MVAVTVCNMNQALKSVVKTLATNGEEYSMVQSLCTHAVDETAINSKAGKWAEFRKLLIKVGRVFAIKINSNKREKKSMVT